MGDPDAIMLQCCLAAGDLDARQAALRDLLHTLGAGELLTAAGVWEHLWLQAVGEFAWRQSVSVCMIMSEVRIANGKEHHY